MIHCLYNAANIRDSSPIQILSITNTTMVMKSTKPKQGQEPSPIQTCTAMSVTSKSIRMISVIAPMIHPSFCYF
jgi:hypothetical protein